ncbi:uncharacterized protein LOC121861493 isoform X2 [Homarus americanus]|uniref:uncharacterized protein LOC121861493 isoform X2 n=1 Tax=Homarus americanus TaxID=6706 RepID=UPI001C437B90|nr:uncharacterized protein LOC121861493 isoform X2 [Homarus americanus]
MCAFTGDVRLGRRCLALRMRQPPYCCLVNKTTRLWRIFLLIDRLLKILIDYEQRRVIMSDSGICNSPGRQRRSTERSRENIREYVKLLGKKVSDSSSGPKSPRSLKEGKSPVGSTSSKLQSDEEQLEGESSPTQLSSPGRKELSLKEKVMKKASISPGKSPKAKRKLETEIISTFGLDFVCDDEVNENLDDSKMENQPLDVTDKVTSGEKSIMADEGSVSSLEKHEETKQNSQNLKEGKDAICVISNTDLTQGFCGFDTKVQSQQKGKEASKVSSTITPIKKSTPKSEKTEAKSDSPPDLVLFLKEGRGRAQNWTDPPTLDPESIATRRRTRVPEDLKALALSKMKCTMQDKNKKDSKEVQKKDGKKDKKNKVMDTPESLKRLAQHYPIKDSGKSSSTNKQESHESTTSNEIKILKKVIAKNITESESKTKLSESSSSSDDGLESNIVKRQKRKKKAMYDVPSAIMVDITKDDQVLQSSKEAQISKTSYLNLDNILHQVSENKAESRIPVVIMSNSEKVDREIKAMPRSKKKGECDGQADKAVLKMALSQKSSGIDIKYIKGYSLVESRASSKHKQKDLKCFKEAFRITELKPGESGLDISQRNVIDDVLTTKENTDNCDNNPRQSDVSEVSQINEDDIPTKLQDPRNNDTEGNNPVPKLANSSSATTSNAVFTSSLLTPGVSSPHKPPLVVSVADFLSLRLATVNSGASTFSPRKLNLKLPSLKGMTAEQILKNTIGIGKDSLIIKGGILNSVPKTILNTGDERSQTPQNATNQQCTLSSQRGPLLDYTDIETEEVVVGGETDDSSGQTLNVGELSTEISLLATEELDSSSEDDSNKAPEPLPTVKKEMMSPEGRVALDHSYSSGSLEKTKGSNSARKKSPVTYEKSLTPRPVYSSASLAKRSLDIMMHNDKINILRQMSQIFNHEKPVQPDTDNTVSSSDGEGEEDVKENQNKSDSTTQNKTGKKRKTSSNTENNNTNVREHLIESSDNDGILETSSSSRAVSKDLTELDTASSSLTTSSKVDASPSKIMVHSDEDIAREENTPEQSENVPKDFSNSCVDSENGDETNPSDMCVTPKKNTKRIVTADSPFLGFPDPSTKVHHVPVYSVAPDEMIHVQSHVGPGGEVVDIVDGFAFISFNTQEEMTAYTHKQNTRGERGHHPWLKKKRKKRKKLLIRSKKHQHLGKHEAQDMSESSSQLSKEISSNDTGAFASNDLDTYLDHNSHLNISYTIPKCKATEEGVTRLDDDGIPQDNKTLQIPAQVPESILMESHSSESFDTSNVQASNGDTVSDSVHQYEEVNAIDILYPKEKYKYYYNKELCKETKADGSNVFVRRAGKLVPLTSVFKSHKPPVGESSNKKTVELVYIYDKGKLLTLGGSLTKINPSNSDSVRARVVLPVGIPPILKGEIVQTRAKEVQAVEINEDMAKFALSALQSPNPREERLIKACNNDETPVVAEADVSVPQDKNDKTDCAEKCEEKEPNAKVPENVLLVPTKRNILDIIAAKLAMSDEESDEKEEEKTLNTTEKAENIAEKVKNSEEKDGKENNSENTTTVGDKETKKDMETKSTVECVMTDEKLEMKKEDLVVESPTQKIVDPEEQQIDEKCKPETEDKDVTALNNSKDENKVKDEASEDGVTEETTNKNTDVDTKELNKVTGELAIKDEKDQIKDLVETEKELKENNSMETTDKADTKEVAEELKNISSNEDDFENVPCALKTESEGNSSSSQEEIKEENADKKQVTSVPEVAETNKTEDIIAQKAGGKSRVFKKNMYRFPSLSREMKRLNMNFVKYVPQEHTPEEEMTKESGPKEDCNNEHCKLGCVCDSLTCRRRIMDHCGRMECMFECTCRDENWKHSVSGTGRTMNAVSIFNLDREQNEGLAVREKDFKRTVIQTGSEVILVGAERKKRERKIPGRYRDSAMWTGTDYVAVNSPNASEPELTTLPELPSIPLAEASRYIKSFRLNVPWYDIKGISIWCMDHSCYDCRCLKDPSFSDCSKEETHKKNEILTSNDHFPNTSSALDAFEEALREKTGEGLISPQESEVVHVIPQKKACCTIVNVIVNNAEARRRYSWKLKDWYHTVEEHCARTTGYSKQTVSEETKHLTLVGVAAREITPEQMVETVVKSLRQPKEKQPLLQNGGNFVSIMEDSHILQNALGVTSEHGELKTDKPKTVQGTVPLVDLTVSSNVDGKDSSPVLGRILKQPKTKSKKANFDSSKDMKILEKRRISGSFDISSVSPSAKRSRQEDIIRQPALSLGSLSSSVESVCQDENKAALTTERECEGVAILDGKRRLKRPLSLLEMMVAEERRGELELDLSNNLPGNALLVAEARFRKLINMNIIGVIGINKAGRCIIGTVDSLESLSMMQRIHNMISNSTLDVGPNMREIFFPPPYVGTRPRFVMIRCDINCKWEIVGVVQKKGPSKTSRPHEQKTRIGLMNKSSSFVPQVIDLEEEEKQKEQEKTEKPDVVVLHSEKEKPDVVNDLLSLEKDSGAWEGSLPLITGVHSVSDSNMAELIGSPERGSNDSVEMPPCQSSLSESKQPFTTKALPDLVPIFASSVEEYNREISQVKESMEAQNVLPVSTISTGSCEQEQQAYIATTAASAVTKTTNSLFTPVTSTPGMRTFTLNQSSGRVFGDLPAEGSSPLTSHTEASPVLPQGCSPQPAVLGSGPSGKSSVIPPKVIPGSSHYILSIPESSSSVKDDADSSVSRPSDIPPQNKSLLSPILPANTPVCIAPQTKVGECSSTVVSQNLAGPSMPNSKMLYIPVSSGCFSKMMFVPTVSGIPSNRMMLLPTIPSGGGGVDSGKLKMVLLPSAQESNKMILVPSSAENSDVLAGNTPATSVTSDSEKKKMLVLPPTVLSNLISKTPNLEQRSKIMFPRPTIINDSQTFQSSCTGTLLVPIKPAGTVSPKLDEIVPFGKAEDNTMGAEVNKESSDQDNSDDVVVIGPGTNSLTITRVRTASESTFPKTDSIPRSSCTSPSLQILPTPPVCSGGTAETNVVSSVTTITSTLPGNPVSAKKDSSTVEIPSDVSAKAKGSDTPNSSEDMVIVKTSLNAIQLNALLQSTHKELLKDGDGSSVARSSKTLDPKEVPCKEEEKLSEVKSDQVSSASPAINETFVADSEQKSSEEVEEVGSKQVPIKRGGYHWSAVDLSLNFKSVKLEWLLGTIRKNVLMNIYQMSLQTSSPVTLSVKNGTSTSMLYGLARRDLLLPILILGSVVSAVMSSSSTPNANLFKVNAIKYFIREKTGELSSYTYDISGDFLVKLASKKRGDGGEMIGIGEKVPIQKMREPICSVKDSSANTQSGETNEGSTDKKSALACKSKVHDCSCAVVGDFICMGHSAPQWKKNDSMVSSANNECVSSRPKSSSDQSCTILQKAAPSSISSGGVSPRELPLTKGSNIKSSPEAGLQLQGCSTMPGSVIDDSCHEKDSQGEILSTDLSSVGKDEGKCVSDSESEYVCKADALSDQDKQKNTPNILGIRGLDFQEDTLICSAEDENEDIDILGDFDMDSSMSSLLKKQLIYETAPGPKTKGNQARTPGEVAKNLLSMQGSKRKIDAVSKSYERPCPRSKKRIRKTQN